MGHIFVYSNHASNSQHCNETSSNRSQSSYTCIHYEVAQPQEVYVNYDGTDRVTQCACRMCFSQYQTSSTSLEWLRGMQGQLSHANNLALRLVTDLLQIIKASSILEVERSIPNLNHHSPPRNQVCVLYKWTPRGALTSSGPSSELFQSRLLPVAPQTPSQSSWFQQLKKRNENM